MSPLDTLRGAPSEVCPALLLHWFLRERELRGVFSVRDGLAFTPYLDKAIEEGNKAAQTTHDALSALRGARTVEACAVPEGF